MKLRSRTNPVYNCWQSMLQRCNNPNHPSFPRYGGRGIAVCERWLEFDNFAVDMGPRPHGSTIDREKNDLGYSPGNCSWKPHRVNCQNTAHAKRWTVAGQTFPSLSAAAAEFAVAEATVLGWCEGYARLGRRYPPRPGCHSAKVYP